MGGRQVAVRGAMVAAAFAYVGLLAVLAFLVRTETAEESVVGSSDGTYTSSLTITTKLTLWQAQGTPIAVILGVLTALVLVGAASLAWRVGHRSSRAGVSALVAAGLLGAVALLGLLSIGIFLVPVVVLLVVVGLPLSAFAASPISAQ